ncbi:hypothetical protein K493DRAFT_21141 [Basidiobolus meristosporus CBS 931.73]|uniref:Uncharacterized protein n=1 Tax=Basidiobolus meristosporus CBS 931.73 TaxID=1314790 RepID=A0A1Y1YEX0_9FUNG|nr:hypothetical protein K493DRAFT_21141 [Basidiobolus meristosporus CBS 931.73]|eukprot:ORX96134.1 hypothetical protein K493DRAFT_21141 [Basidiobolus meristosporus CBS 931.73]
MFRHPYPVGYRATKEHLGRVFDMNIRSGDKGPIFEVAQVGTLQRWQGPTPTAPWTEACLTSRSKGTRVSGPLFFGFSDPLTQKMIEGLPNYEPYDLVFPAKAVKKSRSRSKEEL